MGNASRRFLSNIGLQPRASRPNTRKLLSNALFVTNWTKGATEGIITTNEHKYDDVRGKGFLAQARRERRAYLNWGCEEATKPAAKRACRPDGCAVFGLGRRCSSVAAPLRGMRPPRASPQAKNNATNVIVLMLIRTYGCVREFLYPKRESEGIAAGRGAAPPPGG